MDDLLREFLTETTESLDNLDVEMVKFEQDPNDPGLLSHIFRLVHTIKGTCGFLDLPRLETLAHAAENVLGKFRDGDLAVSADAVSLILQTLDRIKTLISTLEQTEAEPEGEDGDLIAQLDALARGECAPADPGAAPAPEAQEQPPDAEQASRPAEDDADEPLIVRVGGLSAVDAAVELMYRKILKDPELTPFFDGVNMTMLQGRQVEFMTMALGGPDDYSGGDLEVIHRPLVDRGLDSTHFDKLAGYLHEALEELEIPADVIQEVLDVVGGTRDAVPSTGDYAASTIPTPESTAQSTNEVKAEDKNQAPPRDTVASQSIRVNVDMLENLMTMVSELVLSRNQLLQIVRKYEESEFAVPLQRLNLVTTELQEGVMKTRMQPIGNAWSKLPRIVRDLALELGKKIELQMVGAETELDRQVLEMIKDPLTHMVRNSADHGIEKPDERRKAGKPETGKIVLNAYHEDGHIIIEVKDDGWGINLDKVRQKVIANGMASEAELEGMSEKQLQQFIFKPGFSTAEAVTNVSGRGVGMDVVCTNIEKIGGHVELKSAEGKGSTFIIKIPLTLAIVSSLIVECGGDRFAIPQISVEELVRVTSNSEHRIETINDTPVLRLRNQLLPLVALDEMLKLRPKRDLSQFAQNHKTAAVEAESVAPVAEGDAVEAVADAPEAAAADSADDGTEVNIVRLDRGDSETFIVVTRVGTYSFGIIVDQVFESEEIVVKPMTPILRGISIFSGNTILGDGSVIMILDPNGIAAASGGVTLAEARDAAEDDTIQDVGDSERTTLLVFRAGGNEPKAVPLALVARLEELDVTKIEEVDHSPMVQYRGRLMPLVSVNQSFKRAEEGRQHVIVFTDGDYSMGLMVDEIIDIVEDRLDIEIASDSKGILGTAVIGGNATEVIDTGYYLVNAFGDWYSKVGPSSSSGAERRSTVLLVDDSPFFRHLLTPLLKVAGYQVTAVEGAKAALSLRDAGQSFDVIISDIEMPEMNGFEFAEEIKQDDRWQDIPMVALSAYSSTGDLDKGREAGFDDYVTKFDREAL